LVEHGGRWQVGEEHEREHALGVVIVASTKIRPWTGRLTTKAMAHLPRLFCMNQEDTWNSEFDYSNRVRSAPACLRDRWVWLEASSQIPELWKKS
jgi:hypothetical protein